MDSLNFFFGLKAVKTSAVLDKPVSGTAIVYTSKHGTTQKVALLIKELLMEEEVTLINLNDRETVDLSQCKRIIVGGSIHMGQIPKSLHTFCCRHAELLQSKPLGLFLCCMYEGQKAAEQFNNAFPEDIRKSAASKALMGYELYFDRMNRIERMMTKKITGLSDFKSQINHNELNRFVKELKYAAGDFK